MIFVFGSNESGRHGAGAAKTAHMRHGAEYGCSYGQYGNSFAIPTMDHTITKPLELAHINDYVRGFLAHAYSQSDLQFQVTRIGCGLAGLKDEDIAPMFAGNHVNCYFDSKWHTYLGDIANYWGTF